MKLLAHSAAVGKENHFFMVPRTIHSTLNTASGRSIINLMLRGIFLDSDIMYLSLEAWKVKSKYNLGFVSCHNPSYIVKDQKVKVKVTQSCPTLPDPMDCIVQGRNTGVGSLSLVQGIFPTQRLNLGLPPCRQILTSSATREAQEYWSG